MIRVVVTLALLALCFVSLYGWGTIVRRAAHLERPPWPLVAGLGLATWIFLGGLLNLAHLAYAPMLDAVVIAGWALAVWDARSFARAGARPRRPASVQEWLGYGLPWAAVVAVAAFVAATQVPPRAYNFHDDFLAYLVHPVRMLATGSVYGSPFSSVGRGTLGGQAFLHAFVLAHFPIAYANAVDALGCLVLLLAMLVSFANRCGPAPVPALLAVAVAVAVNPQYVNTSALYSASALIVAVMLLPRFDAEDGGSWGDGVRGAVPYGLAYAALVAVKVTFLPFIAIHFVLLVTAIAIERARGRTAARSGVGIAGLTIAFALPWLAAYAPHYAPMRRELPDGAALAPGPVNPFDTETLFYGSTVLDYTLLVAIGLAIGGALFATRRADPTPAERRATAAAACLAPGVLWTVLLAVLAPMYGRTGTAVRYFCPVAIAAAPAALLLGWHGLHVGAVPWIRAVRPALVVAALAAVALFGPDGLSRARQAVDHGSILAFRGTATGRDYLAFNDMVLNGPYRDGVRQAQELVPPGETLMAWIGTPFYLDFRRNRVLEVDQGGLINRWETLPDLRYVLWSYQGFNVRSLGACEALARDGAWIDRLAGAQCARWKRLLAAIGRGSEILFDDGETVLFRTASPVAGLVARQGG